MQAEILSILLVRYPESVTTADLIDALWPDPDNEPAWPENVLHQHMGRLRQRVGVETIVSDWRGYRLAA